MIRDFTYIDDIAEGTIHTLDHVPDAAKCPKQRALQSIQHRLLGADAARRRLPDERRHHEARGGMRLQAPLEPARRHRRIHEVEQERQEPAEVGLLLDAGHKMPAGSLTRPREKFGNSEFTRNLKKLAKKW